MAERTRILEMARRRHANAALLSKEQSLAVEGERGRQSAGVSGAAILKEVVEKGEELCKSEAFQDLECDEIKLSGKWRKEQLLATNESVHVLTHKRDLIRLQGRLCEFEVSLFGSSSLPLLSLYNSARKNIVCSRRDGTSVGGPSLSRCLAWLSRASQCRLHSLVPHGELFPAAQRYVDEKLCQTGLPQLTEQDEREMLAVTQTSRTLSLLSCVDLRLLSPSDAAILLFAVCKISIDRLANSFLHTKVVDTIRNTLDCAESRHRNIIHCFADTFTNVSDDIAALNVCVQLFRMCCPRSTCLVLLSAVLIHRAEKGELCCEENIDSLSERSFIGAHLKIVMDIVPDIHELFSKDKNGERALLSTVDAALTPQLLRDADAKTVRQLRQLLDNRKRELIRTGRPDDALLETQLRCILTRVEVELGSEKLKNEAMGKEDDDLVGGEDEDD